MSAAFQQQPPAPPPLLWAKAAPVSISEPQWGKRIKIKSKSQVIHYEIKLEKNSHIVSSHIV